MHLHDLGIEVDDALAIAEPVDIWGDRAERSRYGLVGKMK
jgi:hypothetical protein